LVSNSCNILLMSSLQAALLQQKGSSKRTRSDEGDEPLQHSLKRLRVHDSTSSSATPSPSYQMSSSGFGVKEDYLSHPSSENNYQQLTRQPTLQVPRRYATRLPQHSNLYRYENGSNTAQTLPDFQPQQQRQQNPGQETSSAYLPPMNRLLGNLHQERIERMRVQSNR